MNIMAGLGKILRYRAVLLDMSFKQLKAKYCGSALGWWWAVAIPVLLAASISFVFVQVFKTSVEHFTFFVLSGLLPWLFFSSALSEATNSFVTHAAELRQGIFPRAFIPMSTVTSNFFNFLIGLAFLLPCFIWIKPGIVFVLPFLILIMVLQFFFLVGLGFIFSVVNIFWRDLSYLLTVVLTAWFWITPVFYTIDSLAWPYRGVCLWNPVTSYVLAYQDILFKGLAPSFLTLFISVILAVFFAIAGYVFFLIKEPQLLKKL